MVRTELLALGAAALAACGRAAAVFDVTKYGATGDGVSYDTGAVRDAAAALARNGGGVLLFPGLPRLNATYLTGAFNLSSNCELRIGKGAVILGSTRGEDWPLIQPLAWYSGSMEHQALIHSDGADNITVTGGGTIDGQGSVWWACAGHEDRPPCADEHGVSHSRPHLVMIVRAKTVVFSSLHVRESPMWTLHFAWVTGLRVSNLTVYNPPHSPNSDGIDIDCSQDVIVEDSEFDVNDDILCVKSGKDYRGRHFGRPSRDIIFRNIEARRGHGITIGSETSGDVFNVTFDGIFMDGTNCGPRLKSQRGRGGVVDGVVYKNIRAVGVKQMFQLTLDYHAGLEPTNKTATPRFRNILFENVHFTGSTDGGVFQGLKESPVENVALRNVVFGDKSVHFGTCEYVTNGTCDMLSSHCPPCFQRVGIIVV